MSSWSVGKESGVTLMEEPSWLGWMGAPAWVSTSTLATVKSQAPQISQQPGGSGNVQMARGTFAFMATPVTFSVVLYSATLPCRASEPSTTPLKAYLLGTNNKLSVPKMARLSGSELTAVGPGGPCGPGGPSVPPLLEPIIDHIPHQSLILTLDH